MENQRLASDRLQLIKAGAALTLISAVALGLSSCTENETQPDPSPTALSQQPRVEVKSPLTAAQQKQAEEDGKKILQAAHKFDGVYFRFGGGHISTSEFHKLCPDPTKPVNNQPHGPKTAKPEQGGSDPLNGGNNGNPSPCGIDSSGEDSQALNIGLKLDMPPMNVTGFMNNEHFVRVDSSEVVPGNFAVIPNHHIEIVDHMEGGVAHTVGAHRTGTASGPSTGTFPVCLEYVR